MRMTIDGVEYELNPVVKEEPTSEPVKEIVPSEREVFGGEGYWIGSHCDIILSNDNNTKMIKDKNVIPRKEQAEAILALCQLLQLRDETWRRDNNWKPVDVEYTLSIIFIDGKIETDCGWANELLCFSSVKIRDEFLEKHRTLIEKLLALYI